MTQEEKAKAYDEALERAKAFEKKYGGDYAAYIFPELCESEDEKIRKNIIHILQVGGYMSPEEKDKAFAYLEKQKTSEEAIKYVKENHSPDEVSDFQAAMNIAVAKAYDKGVQDTLEKQKEHEPIDECNMHEPTLDEARKWNEAYEKGHSFGRKWIDAYEKGYSLGYENGRNEKKPILEVFGFKVGDAVRLKDGDGRKHIIKSFEEVEGLHGPNFYHVEFEDNSARDGIYPDEEYPNGYYTQMEKFEEEQKPAEWSLTDSTFIEEIDETLFMAETGRNEVVKNQIERERDWLKSLPKRFNIQPKQEQNSSEPIPDSVKFDEGFKTGREVGFREGVESVKTAKYLDLGNASQDYVYNHFCPGADFTPDYIKGLMEDAFIYGANWQKEQTKQEWSEEDEKMLDSIVNVLEVTPSARFIPIKRETMIPWLNSLPERFNLQPKQEWSEEDEKMLEVISYKISQHQGNDERSLFTTDEAEFIDGVEDKLKSLRPRPHWKPTEEQLKALLELEETYVLEHEVNQETARLYMVIKSLKEQLLKLMRGEL